MTDVISARAPLAYKRGDHSLLPYDPIFFRKVDIKVGTILVCMGRTTSGTHWRVSRIKSDLGYGKGVHRVDVVQKMNDKVRINRMDIREVRVVSFGYLSYSAIWRLGRDEEDNA